MPQIAPMPSNPIQPYRIGPEQGTPNDPIDGEMDQHDWGDPPGMNNPQGSQYPWNFEDPTDGGAIGIDWFPINPYGGSGPWEEQTQSFLTLDDWGNTVFARDEVKDLYFGGFGHGTDQGFFPTNKAITLSGSSGTINAVTGYDSPGGNTSEDAFFDYATTGFGIGTGFDPITGEPVGGPIYNPDLMHWWTAAGGQGGPIQDEWGGFSGVEVGQDSHPYPKGTQHMAKYFQDLDDKMDEWYATMGDEAMITQGQVRDHYGDLVEFRGEGGAAPAGDFYSPDDFVDLWQQEEWEAIFSPILGADVPIEEWLELYGEYFPNYDPAPVHELNNLREAKQNEIKQNYSSLLESVNSQLGETGFNDNHYQITEMTNQITNEYQSTMGEIDTMTDLEIAAHYESFYNDFLAGIPLISEAGGFDYCAIWPDMEGCN